MGFLGSVVSSVTGAISGAVSSIGNVVSSAASSVISSAKGILGGITDGFVDSIAGGLKNVVGNLPLVGGLLSNMIGKGQEWAKGALGSLMSGGLGALQNMLTGLLSRLNPQQLENGTSVTPPPLDQRFNPANLATVQHAATAAAAAATGAAPAGSSGQALQDLINTPGDDFTAKAKAMGITDTNSKEFKMLAFQNKLQEEARAFEMLSKILSIKSQTSQNIVQNMR